MSYEEDNWDRLSPRFRDAHNRLRQARGLETIPPPKVDRYVAPQQRAVTAIDPNDPEVMREIRARAMALGIRGGDEGFTIKSGPVEHGPSGRQRDGRDEGFSIR